MQRKDTAVERRKCLKKTNMMRIRIKDCLSGTSDSENERTEKESPAKKKRGSKMMKIKGLSTGRVARKVVARTKSKKRKQTVTLLAVTGIQWQQRGEK